MNKVKTNDPSFPHDSAVNLEGDVLSNEILSIVSKLPEEFKIKYHQELTAFLQYLKSGQYQTESGLEFPLDLPAEVFRGYLLYLTAAFEANNSKIAFIQSNNPSTNFLMQWIVMTKIVSSGGKVVLEDDGKEVRLLTLEAQIAEAAILRNDYSLFLKLAVDGGPEFSRLASRLLYLLQNQNFKPDRKDTEDRENAIRANELNLRNSNDWEAMRLLPIISDKEDVPTTEEMFWTAANIIMDGMKPGLKISEVYEKKIGSAIKELAIDYLCKYNAAGEIVEDSHIEELTAICRYLVQIKRWKMGSGEADFAREEARSLTKSLCNLLGEIIGPKFIQKTVNKIITTENLQARLIGADSAELLLGEIDLCLNSAVESGIPNSIDEKTIREYQHIITTGYGWRKILERNAVADLISKNSLFIKQKKLNVKDAEAVTRDLLILGLCVDGVKSVNEMLSVIKLMSELKDSRVAHNIYEKTIDKYWQMPGAMHALLKRMNDGENFDESNEFVATFAGKLTSAFFRANPHILQDLINELIAGDYRTFHTACLVAGKIIQLENGWGEATETICKSVFDKNEGIYDPDRMMIIRTISRGSGEKGAVFFRKAFIENPAVKSASFEQKQKWARMLDMQVQKPTEKSGEGNDISLGELKITGQLEERDINGLVDYIITNRSIMLSGDGKVVKINSDDSNLAENFSEIRFTLNKEGKKNPHSLACNIALKLKENGASWYFSIDAENNLLWRRNLGDGKFDVVSLPKFIEQISAKKNANGESGEKIMGEIHYLILKKLEEVFVRQTRPNKDIVKVTPTPTEVVDVSVIEEIVQTPSEEVDQSTESSEIELEIPETSTSDMPPAEDMPVAGIREERPGIVDLADQFKEGKKMAQQDLKSEDEDKEKVELKMKIGENKELALQIFGKALAKSAENLKNGTGNELLELSEELPEKLENLIVYVMCEIDGVKYFEEISPQKAYEGLRDGRMSSKDVFVRTHSAHSQTLPYMKMEAADELDKKEMARLKRFWAAENVGSVSEDTSRKIKEAVRQSVSDHSKKDLRMAMLAESREAKDINLKAKEKILFFEVDDFPEHREIFERMKMMSQEEIRRDVSWAARRELDEKLHEARARLVHPALNGDEYMAGLDAYEAEKVRLEAESAASIEFEVKRQLEIQTGFKTVTEKIGDTELVKLRMPAVFNFNQTFNRGRFKNLAELFESLAPEKKKKYDEGAAI